MNTQFVYTFKTRKAVINHLRALAQLSSSIEHSPFPMSDFECELPYLMDDLFVLKQLANKNSKTSKIYIAFRTTGFDSSTIFHHFKSTVTAYQTSLIACYAIQFVDGYYTFRQISLN